MLMITRMLCFLLEIQYTAKIKCIKAMEKTLVKYILPYFRLEVFEYSK